MFKQFAYTPLTDRQRLQWALMLAFSCHAVVLLAVNFNLFSPPPPQPVFSLNLALSQRAGGAKQDQILGVPLPPSTDTTPPQDASRVDDAQQIAISRSQAALQQALTDAEDDQANNTEQLDTPEPEPETPKVEVANLGQQQAQSRSRTIRPGDQTTLEGFYAERWRLQIQAFGNQYFADKTDLRNLQGKLTLDVAVRSDGTLLSIKLLQSSGQRKLDQAARNIVMLASPFAPFPESLRQRYDVLHIVRTWEFDQQGMQPH